MNTMRNKVQLIGNVGKTPTCIEVGNNRKLLKFPLATNERQKNAEGEWVTLTTWHNLIAWGKTASLMEQMLHKGTEVVIEGKINNRTYEDENGRKHYISEVEVRDFMLVGNRT